MIVSMRSKLRIRIKDQGRKYGGYKISLYQR